MQTQWWRAPFEKQQWFWYRQHSAGQRPRRLWNPADATHTTDKRVFPYSWCSQDKVKGALRAPKDHCTGRAFVALTCNQVRSRITKINPVHCMHWRCCCRLPARARWALHAGMMHTSVLVRVFTFVCLSQQYRFCSLISSFLYASNLLTMTFIVIIIVIKNTCTFKSLETCAILVIFARRHMRKSTVFWTVRCFGHQ